MIWHQVFIHWQVSQLLNLFKRTISLSPYCWYPVLTNIASKISHKTCSPTLFFFNNVLAIPGHLLLISNSILCFKKLHFLCLLLADRNSIFKILNINPATLLNSFINSNSLSLDDLRCLFHNIIWYYEEKQGGGKSYVIFLKLY